MTVMSFSASEKLFLTAAIKEKTPYLVVMGPSWIFPARAEPSYEGSEPRRAKLGHLNFRAEKNFFSNFSQVFNYQILLVYCVPKKFCNHLLANKVFLELHYMKYKYQMHNLV